MTDNKGPKNVSMSGRIGGVAGFVVVRNLTVKEEDDTLNAQGIGSLAIFAIFTPDQHFVVKGKSVKDGELITATTTAFDAALRDLGKNWDLVHQLSPRLVDSCDIVERHPRLVFDVHSGLALADGHEPLLRAEAAHEDDPHARKHHGREYPREEGREPGILRLPGELDVRLLEFCYEPGILDSRRDKALRSAA